MSLLVIMAMIETPMPCDWLRPDQSSDLRSAVVARDSLLIAIGRNHPLAAQPRLTLRDLAKERFIIFPGEAAWWDQAETVLLCQEAGFTPETLQSPGEIFSSLSYVHAGVYVSIVPASIVRMAWPDVRFEPITPFIRGELTQRAQTPMTRKPFARAPRARARSCVAKITSSAFPRASRHKSAVAR
ncbi:MAG: LysR family substrate-binding domain-containing protein [Anaerolineae bacterium]|nr:LysR family substrate-binding domain-containing protein [Gemmatimonadaceae bacterium]